MKTILMSWLAGIVALGLVACSGGDGETQDIQQTDVGRDNGPVPPRTFVAVTFNSGTTEGLNFDDSTNGGYTSAHAAISDQWYGDGLAWLPAVEAARSFFELIDPDIVVFQEIFHAGECPGIPVEAHKDFYCATWTEGNPTVAQYILGDGWQVACNTGKPDKCAAVNRRFGAFRGCQGDFCLDGLEGYTLVGCGKGARVARGVVDLVDGGTLTLVNVHASSGMKQEDMECRVRQVDQVFQDLGNGQPAANGEGNLIMGDFNTDPGRLSEGDASAARWLEFTGEDKQFHFVTKMGPDVMPTYSIFNIDHMVSDEYDGDCWAAGISDGHPPVIDAVYFDHVPIVCALREIQR